MKWKVIFHQTYIVSAVSKDKAVRVAEKKMEADLEEDGVIGGATIDMEVEKLERKNARFHSSRQRNRG